MRIESKMLQLQRDEALGKELSEAQERARFVFWVRSDGSQVAELPARKTDDIAERDIKDSRSIPGRQT